MKRTFLAKRNTLFSSANVSWGAGALVFAILALAARLLAPNLFLHIVTPALSVADAISAKSHVFFNSFGDIAALAAKNEQLARENAALVNENTALVKKTASIKELANASGLSQNAAVILAGVVARPPSSAYVTLVLAAGERAGVMLGQEAFGEGGVPLGTVSAVTADFSRITFFSAPGMVTRGWVGRAGLPVDIFGAGGGALQASVARAAGVAVGDAVFAPGPGMLPIGTVARIDGDPASPSAVLRIAPAINPFSVMWVALRDAGTLSDSFFLATSTP